MRCRIISGSYGLQSPVDWMTAIASRRRCRCRLGAGDTALQRDRGTRNTKSSDSISAATRRAINIYVETIFVNISQTVARVEGRAGQGMKRRTRMY